MKDLLHIPSDELAQLGIVEWGYTCKTKPLSFERFSSWLEKNKGVLPFLESEKNIHYRSNLNAYWPHAKSAIVFLFSYTPTKKAMNLEKFHRVAAYTLGFEGRDYHELMKANLHAIAHKLQTQYNFEFRHSHDTEAVLERDLAHRAGLGWFGKNAMMIHRTHGSYFMIGSLLFDRTWELEDGKPTPDHCGTCRSCVDACPTDAIDPETRTIKVKDCLSTWTIEERDENILAPKGSEKGREEIFGCDICQDVCPWNNKPLENTTPYMAEKSRQWMKFFQQDLTTIATEISQLTNRGFLRFVEGTPYGRPGRKAFLRTLSFWIKRN